MCLVFAALILGQASTDAQSPSLPLPVRVDTLISAKVGEPREFWVSLPDRYDESTEKYPVIFMMDGDSNFNSGVVGGVRQAAWSGEIPEFIIVGIKNTNRSTDIFPEEVTYPDGTKDGGRANQYLDFVRDRDNLVGGFKGGRRELVLVMGEYDVPTVVSLNGALKETISTRAPAGLTCRLRVIENGEHVPSDALIQGLRVLFQGWKITRPFTESNFAEIRAQVDRRLEQFGVAGKIDEEVLKSLGDRLIVAAHKGAYPDRFRCEGRQNLGLGGCSQTTKCLNDPEL